MCCNELQRVSHITGVVKRVFAIAVGCQCLLRLWSLWPALRAGRRIEAAIVSLHGGRGVAGLERLRNTTAGGCVSVRRSGGRGLARPPWCAGTRVRAHRHTTCPLGAENIPSCLRSCWVSASGAGTRLELNFQRRQSRSSVLTDEPRTNWSPVLQQISSRFSILGTLPPVT